MQVCNLIPHSTLILPLILDQETTVFSDTSEVRCSTVFSGLVSRHSKLYLRELTPALADLNQGRTAKEDQETVAVGTLVGPELASVEGWVLFSVPFTSFATGNRTAHCLMSAILPNSTCSFCWQDTTSGEALVSGCFYPEFTLTTSPNDETASPSP